MSNNLQDQLTQILEEYKVDSEIDELHITNQSLKTASLHCKYILYLREWKDKKLAFQIKFDQLKQAKIRYWRGEFSQQELTSFGWTQWQNNKPLKSEIDGMINADPDMNKIRYQLEIVENGISTLESIIKAINGRDFTISNFIKLQQFYNGENI